MGTPKMDLKEMLSELVGSKSPPPVNFLIPGTSYAQQAGPSKAKTPPPETEVDMDVNWPSLPGAPDPSVSNFLLQINLEVLIPIFHKEGINLAEMYEMDHDDLKSIGVTNYKDRKLILKGLARKGTDQITPGLRQATARGKEHLPSPQQY